MLQHGLCVEIRDQERNVIALIVEVRIECSKEWQNLKTTDLYRLSSQDKEGLGSLRQESGEFMDKNILDLVSLLDAQAHTHTIGRGLDNCGFSF